MSGPPVQPSDEPRLPLLESFVEERLGAGQRFDVTAALLMQHQLPTIVPMTRALISLGIDPERLHWVDIPYTADPGVQARLAELGIPESNFAPSDYGLTTPYEPYQRRRVTEKIAALRSELGRDARLLVLDDGGYFADAAACFADDLPRVCLVEQTRRGIMKLLASAASRRYAESTRFVNVAEARPKLTIEPPLIADTVVEALLETLAARWEEIGAGPTLILGYGAIGRAVARALVDGGPAASRSTLHVYDPDPAAADAAGRDGFDVWDRSPFSSVQYRLVIGSSGTASFGVSDRPFLADGAILVSTSSGAAELSREQFIELADTHPADEIWVHDRDTLSTRDIHSTIRIQLVDRCAHFLNGGFPVNFNGTTDCDPPERIQLTRTMMLAGAVQAVEASEPGIQPLREDMCDWLEERFREIVGHDPPTQELPGRLL
jgi:hypothetical protein